MILVHALQLNASTGPGKEVQHDRLWLLPGCYVHRIWSLHRRKQQERRETSP